MKPCETDLLVVLPIWLLSPLHLHHFLLASVRNSQLVLWLVLVSTSDFASACPDMTASYLVHSAATALVFMYVSVLILKGCCGEMPHRQALTSDLQIAGRGRRNPSLTLRGPFPDRESRALKEHVWFWYPLCCWTGNRGEWHWESSADLLGYWTRKGITCLPQQEILTQQFFKEIRTFEMLCGLFSCRGLNMATNIVLYILYLWGCKLCGIFSTKMNPSKKKGYGH